MIKNIYLKKLLKGTIFRVVSLINKIVPKQNNIILLYSGNEGLKHNLIPLFNYLVENNYNDKYKIVCGIESIKYKGISEKNIDYVEHLQSIVVFLKAKHVFYTAGQLPIKPSTEQIVIHMNHGITDYKTVGKLSHINNGDEFFFSYILAPSDIYVPIVAAEYGCNEKNVFVCSEPMVDIFYKKVIDKKNRSIFDGKKFALWLPTFRKSDLTGYSDSDLDDPLLIFKTSDYEKLNQILSDNNVLLIVKLHGAQKYSKEDIVDYANLKVWTNDDMEQNQFDLYDLIMKSDCLIGDYSSVSLQYVLLNRPLAYVIPDIDIYAQKRGFVFENPREYMPGHLIYNQSDFYDFINDFVNNKDAFEEERKKVKSIIHKYDDGKSCERLLALSNIRK